MRDLRAISQKPKSLVIRRKMHTQLSALWYDNYATSHVMLGTKKTGQ